MTPHSTPSLGIIIPVYQNSQSLEALMKTLLLVKESVAMRVEILFVDDGSTDGSRELLRSLQRQFPDLVRVLFLTRNFGQNAAIQAGLAACRSDCAAIISADMQDPPELLIKMVDIWKTGIKLVIAERGEREDALFGRWISRFFWYLIGKFAIQGYPRGGFDYCLVDRQVIREVNAIQEKNTHVFALMFSLGFSRVSLLYKRAQRLGGKSQWTFTKKLKLFIDMFVGFSHTPIRLISTLGLLISLFSFSYALFIVGYYFLEGTIYHGWTSLAALVSLLGGVILFTLGIIGEYLWRILDQVRQRPLYVVSEELNRVSSADQSASLSASPLES